MSRRRGLIIGPVTWRGLCEACCVRQGAQFVQPDTVPEEVRESVLEAVRVYLRHNQRLPYGVLLPGPDGPESVVCC